MKEEKKEFQKAEVEVIRFEKNDIITTSIGNNQQTISGTADSGTETELP